MTPLPPTSSERPFRASPRLALLNDDDPPPSSGEVVASGELLLDPYEEDVHREPTPITKRSAIHAAIPPPLPPPYRTH